EGARKAEVEAVAVDLELDRRQRVLRAIAMEARGQAEQRREAARELAIGVAQVGKELLRQLAAVGAHQDGDERLIAAREAGELSVVDEVGAELVGIGVREGGAELVELCRPAELEAPARRV